MKNDQIATIFNLLNVPKVGSQNVRNLVSKFNTPESIFSLTEQELCSVEGIDQKSAKAIRSYKDFDISKKLGSKTNSYRFAKQRIRYWCYVFARDIAIFRVERSNCPNRL